MPCEVNTEAITGWVPGENSQPSGTKDTWVADEIVLSYTGVDSFLEGSHWLYTAAIQHLVTGGLSPWGEPAVQLASLYSELPTAMAHRCRRMGTVWLV